MAFHGNAANLNVTTDVSAGTYGSGNAIPVINIDSSGRLNSINTSSVTYGTLNANANVGTVGSYAFMQQASGNTQYAPGATLAGSSLRYSDATGRVHNDTPSGNWRCMGYDSGAALTNSGTVGGSAAGSGSLQGGNVQGNLTANVSGNIQGDVSGGLQGGNIQGNRNVNVSGNIQGGKGGSFNVTPSVDVDELGVGGNVNLATDELSITGSTGTIDTDQLNVAGNVAVNVNLGSITVNTTVAYSSTLWLRYS
tara:strand:+ start:478 stop:1233 length:756 start_codon:yes stop_codon:yes gene_type:complete